MQREIRRSTLAGARAQCVWIRDRSSGHVVASSFLRNGLRTTEEEEPHGVVVAVAGSDMTLERNSLMDNADTALWFGHATARLVNCTMSNNSIAVCAASKGTSRLLPQLPRVPMPPSPSPAACPSRQPPHRLPASFIALPARPHRMRRRLSGATWSLRTAPSRCLTWQA